MRNIFLPKRMEKIISGIPVICNQYHKEDPHKKCPSQSEVNLELQGYLCLQRCKSKRMQRMLIYFLFWIEVLSYENNSRKKQHYVINKQIMMH